MSKRSIFEEVDATKTDAPKPAPAAADDGRADRRAMRLWLIVLFALVWLMILVGGLTRLTDSGLSITEWAPVSGAIPPLSPEAWDAEFEKYKAIPEFQIVNKDMTLAEFKVIYWWEWGHRQLGRFIGLVWFAGFLWFAVVRKIPRGWTTRLLGLGILGGLQGAIGWWMVSSGLTGQMVDVASYRLAVHLGLAFVILGLMAWYVFALGRSEMDLFQARRTRETTLIPWTNILLGTAFLQILLGALVAGLDAGRGYTDWPLMGGEVFPSDAFARTPWIANFFENEALTQFNHRLVGYLLFALTIFVWLKARGSALLAVRSIFLTVLVLTIGQMVLGIITVLNAAPLWLAILHQALAILLWVALWRARFAVTYPEAQSVRG